MESKDNMATTYEKIATTTLGSAQATIDFTSIPSTYTDLRLVLVVRTTVASTTDNIRLRFNSDSGGNYSYVRLYGNGTNALSDSTTNASNANFTHQVPGGTAASNLFALCTADIFSYTGSTYKTLLATTANDMNGSGTTQATINLWRSTSSITSVNLFVGSGDNFAANTTATLYGILKA
jgi:hypothetical protein